MVELKEVVEDQQGLVLMVVTDQVEVVRQVERLEAEPLVGVLEVVLILVVMEQIVWEVEVEVEVLITTQEEGVESLVGLAVWGILELPLFVLVVQTVLQLMEELVVEVKLK